MLLRFEIEIYSDHKKLVHETTLLSSDMVMRWRLIIEEYGPEIKYMSGQEHVVADRFSRLSMINTDMYVHELYNVHVKKKKKMCARAQLIPDEYPMDI